VLRHLWCLSRIVSVRHARPRAKTLNYAKWRGYGITYCNYKWYGWKRWMQLGYVHIARLDRDYSVSVSVVVTPLRLFGYRFSPRSSKRTHHNLCKEGERQGSLSPALRSWRWGFSLMSRRQHTVVGTCTVGLFAKFCGYSWGESNKAFLLCMFSPVGPPTPLILALKIRFEWFLSSHTQYVAEGHCNHFIS